MAGVLKKTTGLVGLAVSEAPHDRLRILYTKILTALQNIPRNAAYRIYTEKIVNERLNLIKTPLCLRILIPTEGATVVSVHSRDTESAENSNLAQKKPDQMMEWPVYMSQGEEEPDVQKLENKINSGQIEEVILQAESELSLARKMAQWRPWEPLVEEPPADQWKWPI